MNQTVNAMGDACPIPVVKTKNAIKEMGAAGGTVETFVDNEIAVQNLTKMADQKGYSVQSEQLESNKYRVVMTVGEQTEQQMQETAQEPVVCVPVQKEQNTVVVISSSCMGSGDDALGAVLMKGFIYALSQQDELPKTILFYNGGAKLTCEGAVTLEDLKELEAQGVEIMTCGTCLNHYGLTDKLQVGTVTNMYVIAEKMTQASLIVKP
jgi:selenium metabolism protein YedF